MEQIETRRLGIHLKKLREERKLTLGGVESLSGTHGERINKSYLFRVERGKTVPTIPRLRVLGQVYRVKLSTLLELVESSYEETEKSTTLGMDVAGLTYEDLRLHGVEVERAGDFTKAALFYRAAWDKAAQEAPSPHRSVRIATVRHDLAVALKNSGKLDLAREQAEAAFEQDGVPPSLLEWIRLNLAAIYRRMNLRMLSLEILDGLFARREQLPQELLSGAHSIIGSIFLEKDPRKAAQHYRSSLGIVRALRNPFEECKVLYNIGIAESKSGNYRRAHKTLLRARSLAERKDFSFWISKIQTEIGKTFYLEGGHAQARTVLREAIGLARSRDYYEQLFMSQYYLRKISLAEGDEASAKAAEASMKFFATRLQDSFEELDEFKEELNTRKEERQ